MGSRSLTITGKWFIIRRSFSPREISPDFNLRGQQTAAITIETHKACFCSFTRVSRIRVSLGGYMKFLHTGDLHIGKIVNEFSLIEDQRLFLRQIISIAVKEQADALVIAGDVYDRAIPSAEAVTILDEFLSELIALRIPVLMISGNHDSPERIGFADKILEKQGLYIAGSVTRGIRQVVLQDEFGDINFILIPFVKPTAVGAKSSQEAMEIMLQQVNLENKRNVLVTHYFVTDRGKSPELSDSETTINIGGLDNVEAALFDRFTYVALGHIHKAQKIGERSVYYAGTPVKYSFSETNQRKGLNLVRIDGEGKIQVRQIPIKPLHDMRKIKGELQELMRQEIAHLEDCNDYLQVTLTNREELIDPIGTLRTQYPNTMQLILEKNEVEGKEINLDNLQKSKSLLELYQDFYEIIRDENLSGERMQTVIEAIKEAEGGNT